MSLTQPRNMLIKRETGITSTYYPEITLKWISQCMMWFCLAKCSTATLQMRNQLLLRKAYEKMDTPGMVIINEFMVDEEETGPLFSTLFNLNMLKQIPQGRTYKFFDIKSWLEEAEFYQY